MFAEFDKDVESLAFEAYLSERNRIELKVTKPPDETVVTLPADSRWSIMELRTAVAKIYNMDVENTKIYKGYGKISEVKNSSCTLAQSHIFNGQQISVTDGKATPAGFFSVSFSLYTPRDHKAGIVPLPREEDYSLDAFNQNADPEKEANGSYDWNNLDSSYEFRTLESKIIENEYSHNYGSMGNNNDGYELADGYEKGYTDTDDGDGDNLDAMSNEGVADSAECFSANDEDMPILLDSEGNVAEFAYESFEVGHADTREYQKSGTNETDVIIDATHCEDDSRYNYSGNGQEAVSYAVEGVNKLDSIVETVAMKVGDVVDKNIYTERTAKVVPSTVPDDLFDVSIAAPVAAASLTSTNLLMDDNIDPSDFGERMVTIL